MNSSFKIAVVLLPSLIWFAEVASAASPPERPVSLASPTTGPDGSPLTADDLKELQQMESSVHQFENATKDYRGTVTHIIKQEFEKKRRETLAKYDGQIKDVEQQEKLRRQDAIAALEKFLAKYPNNKRWTPDVIFRLAELYFERSNDEYLAAVDASQKAADAAAKDKALADAIPPAPPTPDYSKTIDLYKRMISEFPDYRLIDGAYYLLGYCLGEMNKEPEAKQAFLALVCENHYKALDPPAPPVPTKSRVGREAFVDPYKDCKAEKTDSRFVPEAWTRIGEYHFDGNELELAIAAYARVLQFKDSPYYDKALYKLAWSYYRADKYPEAIRKFDELVVFADAKKSESGKEGSDLRQEAIQYLGVSFAEKDWNGDGVDDPETGLQRAEAFYRGREKEPHVREIFAKLGDIYFDETEYPSAIAVYRRIQEKWPLAEDNPKLQDKIVQADKRQHNDEQALLDITKLGELYGRKGPWGKAQENKSKVDEAAELAEQALVTVAVEHHKRAQAAKKLAFAKNPPDGKLLDTAAREYSLASQSYANYLQQYPNTKNTYDYTFSYAETLFYAGRFAEAAEQYEKVRDSNLDNRYLEDAAFNAVKAHENQIAGEVAQRKIVVPPIPDASKLTAPVKPIPMPDEMKALQGAYDAYVLRLPQSVKVPTMTYKAAEIEYKYLDFEKARPRMEAIAEKYCTTSDISLQAASAVLASYTIEKNLDKIIEWGERIQKSNCVAPAQVAVGPNGQKPIDIKTGVLQTINDAKFAKAIQDLADKKYEQAADEFVKLVDADPTNKSGTNDKALYNAAVAYENVSRFQAATKLYERIVNDYPKSTFVDDALFRTATNYKRFFEFDKAVVSFQRLATDARFKDSPNRLNSLYNAAVLLENDQAYAESAKLFQQYAHDPAVKRDDQGDAFFLSGTIYLKNKEPQKAIKTFSEYLKTWGSDPKKALEANFHIAEAEEQLKNRPGALREYAKVAEEGARVAPASDAAEFPAHAAFIVAEEELKNLEKMKISGDPKTLGKEIEKFKVEIQKVTELENRAIGYRRVNWVLAGYFRIGYSYELLSRNLGAVASSPCPKEVQKKFGQEGCDAYLEQITGAIEKMVAPIDDEVVKRYRVTLEQASKFGASNEWTKLARLKAHAYKPDEFPLIKDEKTDIQLENPL